MKRSGFKPKAPAPRPVKTLETYTPKPRAAAVAVADTRARMVMPAPKAKPLRDESYRRWVASLPCAHCGIEGYSQAAHSDSAGKGMGLKASDSELMPLCGPRVDEPGCHWLIGTSGVFGKQERRALEAKYVDNTKGIYSEYLGEKS